MVNPSLKRLCAAGLISAFLAGCAGVSNTSNPQTPLSLTTSKIQWTIHKPESKKGSLRPDVPAVTHFTKSTVVAQTSTFAKSVVLVGKSGQPYFFLMKTKLTTTSKYLLVLSYQSLFVFPLGNVKQIRYLDQPAATSLDTSTFPSETDAQMLNALANQSPDGITPPICPDCAFAPSADWTNETPYSAEVEDLPASDDISMGDCSIENCLNDPFAPTPGFAPYGVGTNGPSCFPAKWNYSANLGECVAPYINVTTPNWPTPDFTFGIGVAYFYGYLQNAVGLICNFPGTWPPVDAFTHYLDINGNNWTFEDVNLVFPPGPHGEAVNSQFLALSAASFMNIAFIGSNSMKLYATCQGVGAVPVPTIPGL